MVKILTGRLPQQQGGEKHLQGDKKFRRAVFHWRSFTNQQHSTHKKRGTVSGSSFG